MPDPAFAAVHPNSICPTASSPRRWDPRYAIPPFAPRTWPRAPPARGVFRCGQRGPELRRSPGGFSGIPLSESPSPRRGPSAEAPTAPGFRPNADARRECLGGVTQAFARGSGPRVQAPGGAGGGVTTVDGLGGGVTPSDGVGAVLAGAAPVGPAPPSPAGLALGSLGASTVT